LIKDGIRTMLEDLSNDVAADSAAEHPAPDLIDRAPRIVCVAGRNELDEAAGSLLVHLLRSEQPAGIAEALPAEALTLDRYHSSLEDATLICLSLISTNSPVRARYLVRRLCRRAPHAKILVGFWRLDPGELAAAAATIARPNTAVAISLRDAVTDLQSHVTPGRVSTPVR